MVHWPEAMVTLDVTDGVLFSADAFGTFGALDGKLFADEVMRLVRAALPLRSAGRTIFFGFARPSSAADGSHHGLGHKIAHRADR